MEDSSLLHIFLFMRDLLLKHHYTLQLSVGNILGALIKEKVKVVDFYKTKKVFSI